MLTSQTAHIAVVVGNLSHHNNEVRAVGNKLAPHLVGNKANLRATTGRHFFGGADDLSVFDAFGHELHTLPGFLVVTQFTGFPGIPEILEDNWSVGLAIGVVNYRQGC